MMEETAANQVMAVLTERVASCWNGSVEAMAFLLLLSFSESTLCPRATAPSPKWLRSANCFEDISFLFKCVHSCASFRVWHAEFQLVKPRELVWRLVINCELTESPVVLCVSLTLFVCCLRWDAGSNSISLRTNMLWHQGHGDKAKSQLLKP